MLSMTFRVLVALAICMFFCGCSPGSIHEFKWEGQSVCREIISDLQQVHSRDDLARLEPILKKKFEKLVSIIIEAREFQIKNLEEPLSHDLLVENEISDKLFAELRRVYSIEGGRDIIERAQREAMLRLDGFEKIRAKQKQSRVK